MWWAISIVLAGGVVALYLWLRQQKIRVAWYALALSLAGLLLMVYSVHNFVDFRAEYETVAAWNAMLIFGLPGLLLLGAGAGLALMGQLRLRRLKNAPLDAAG